MPSQTTAPRGQGNGAGQGAQRGRTARAVAAEQDGEAGGGREEGHSVQDLQRAVPHGAWRSEIPGVLILGPLILGVLMLQEACETPH